ncbi:MAG: flavodoxin domain-containing protein, partial [Gammaproteobacteria bacterium]
MSNYILILFYSMTGSVRNIAHAIADGIEDSGMEAKIRTVPRVSPNHEASEKDIPDEGEMYCTLDELAACSGLALGSPTRFGS